MEASHLLTYEVKVPNPHYGLVPDEPEFTVVESIITSQSSMNEAMEWYKQKKDAIKQQEAFFLKGYTNGWSNSERMIFSRAMMLVWYLQETESV